MLPGHAQAQQQQEQPQHAKAESSSAQMVARQLSVPYPEIATPRLWPVAGLQKRSSTAGRASNSRREVAIKALYRDPAKAQHDSQAINELKKEIESFRHLTHKRLVRFMGACFEHPHLCFITEYMPNGSLYNFLHVRKVRLPTRHSMNMCMQLCEGVEYLHTRDPVVVHRDLK
eukprot:g20801.t1